jgi:hypothetical protein
MDYAGLQVEYLRHVAGLLPLNPGYCVRAAEM